nr:ATP-binding protein [Haloplanus sp. XH21]
MTGEILVLHVDDDPDFVTLAATFLERADERIVVETATDADDGMALLDDRDIDCIVSDHDMSGQNGIEFLRDVRETHPDLPFILFTGKGSEQVASDAISAGVTDYLQKETGTDQYAVLANRITNAVESYRSRQALAERNRTLRKYERMVNSMQEAACIYDAEGRFEIVNEFTADWYDTTRDAIQGERSNLIAYIREEADGDPYRELLDGEREQLRGEIERDFPDHGHAVLEYQLTPLDVAGSIEGVVGVVRDISERKRHERELERTNALLSTLFDALPEGVLAEDESRDVLAANQRLTALFDLAGSPAELVGSDCERLAEVASKQFGDSDRFVDRIDEVIADRDPVDGETLTLADGRTFERTYRPIELPDDAGHLWVYRDVTDRVTHEGRLEALNRATQRLLTAETTDEVAEIGVDVAKDILDLEANSIHLYDDDVGLAPVAATDAVFELVGEPPTFTGDDSIAWRVYQGGESLAVGDVHADPDRYRTDTSVQSELYLPIGEYGVLLAGSTTVDAFDQQQVLLGEILASNIATALEQVDQTARLRDRERELSRQNDRLEQFASVISHDLRNPLNVAEGRLELARETGGDEHLDAVEQAHTRMRTLIENLLTLAREGDAAIDRHPVDLASVIEACWGNVDTADATLTVDVDRTVFADESRLKQLFENLIRNAVEHGGDDVTVTVGDLDGGFYVADDGPGIPEDERSHVFDAGYSTRESGRGFGLSIVKQIVEAHGWEISVTESADGGARFEITGVDAER